MKGSAVLIVIAVLAWGCDGETPSDVDGGVRADGGTGPGIDGGGTPDTDGGGTPGTDGGGTPGTDAGAPVTACSAVGLELIDLVNAYRADNGLPAIPASPSLCVVSSAHTRDLADHSPHTAPGGCNMHSWSDQGDWSPCCYTPDHAEAQCMWDKPRELTDYPGNGYENAYRGSSDPAAALAGWMSSPGHNDVILNRGIWASQPWRALGADVHDGFAVLWFGREVDPAR
jgi:hypothetical protein